jgi:hypothetical protein
MGAGSPSGGAPTRRGATTTCAVAWTSQLDVAGGTGQVVLGTAAAFPGLGDVNGSAAVPCGDGHLEAVLVRAAGRAGTWRLVLEGANVEPESVRPVAGDVVLATSGAVLFRVQGRAGERVVLVFRTRH